VPSGRRRRVARASRSAGVTPPGRRCRSWPHLRPGASLAHQDAASSHGCALVAGLSQPLSSGIQVMGGR
jgi:hypothetical protein